MAKGIIYARFSPRPNAHESESIEAQVEACRQYCAGHDVEVEGEYEDRAWSGGELQRPGLWDAIYDLRRGWVLVVYRLDRLARDVYVSHEIERLVGKRGSRILSIGGEGTWGDEPSDRFIRNVLRSQAQYQREATAALTSARMRYHQRHGRRMSQRLPYGWKLHPTNPNRRVEDQDEPDNIDILLALRARDMSSRRIAREMERRGILFRGRSHWYGRTVLRILGRESQD